MSQDSLFDKGKWWEKEWSGMPEFKQESVEPYQTIYVHFENAADAQAFSELVKQKITRQTKYIWYPEATIDKWIDRRYISKLDERLKEEEFDDGQE